MLTGCALSALPASAPVTPVATLLAPHRGPVLVQYCADNTGRYPLDDFHHANALVAASLSASVGANAEGLTLYATRFASDTFDPANALPPFVIPATPTYPILPTSLPTASQANPVYLLPFRSPPHSAAKPTAKC
jgi:hypothetical protein